MRSIVVPLELTVRLEEDEEAVECSTILEPAIPDKFHDGVEPLFKLVARYGSNDLSNTFRVWSVSVYTTLKFYAALAFVNHDLMKSVALQIGLWYFKSRSLDA